MAAAQTVPAQMKVKAQHPGEPAETPKQIDFSSLEQDPISIRNQKDDDDSPAFQAEIV